MHRNSIPLILSLIVPVDSTYLDPVGFARGINCLLMCIVSLLLHPDRFVFMQAELSGFNGQ